MFLKTTKFLDQDQALIPFRLKLTAELLEATNFQQIVLRSWDLYLTKLCTGQLYNFFFQYMNGSFLLF